MNYLEKNLGILVERKMPISFDESKDENRLILDIKRRPNEVVFLTKNGNEVSCESEPSLAISPQVDFQFNYMIGFNGGQCIREILKKIRLTSKLICFEPWPEMLQSLIKAEDFSDIFKDERFQISVGSNVEDHTNGFNFGQIYYYRQFSEVKLLKPFVPESLDLGSFKTSILNRIRDELIEHKANANTLQLIAKHRLENDKVHFFQNDIRSLAEKIKDKPVVIVGIGPSLDYQIDVLKEIQESAILGVTDNALRELLSHGIQPDIVFHVEWIAESLTFYENIELKKSAVLLYGQNTHPSVLLRWPSLKVAYFSTTANMLFPEIEIVNEWEGLKGSTVGDFAVQFFISAKASEIYLVGMDLSCPAGAYHHPNTSPMRSFYGDVTRFSSAEKWNWKLVDEDLLKSYAMSWDGELMPSHGAFNQSIRVINDLVKGLTSNQKIYTTGQLGAKVNVEFRELSELKGLPALEKKLEPSQDNIDRSKVLNLVGKRKNELRLFFYEILPGLSTSCKNYLQSFESAKSGNSDKKKWFLENLQKLESTPKVSWIQDLIMVLDPGIQRFSTQGRLLLESSTDQRGSEGHVQITLEYIEHLSYYKDALEQHLANIEKELNDHK